MYSYFSPLLSEISNHWGYPLEVTIFKGMAQQTLMHIFQFNEGSYLFHIYHNYNNLIFSIIEGGKKGGIFPIGRNLS
jgi:hypothetical protein